MTTLNPDHNSVIRCSVCGKPYTEGIGPEDNVYELVCSMCREKLQCPYCDRLIHPTRMISHKEAFHPLELRKELEPLRTRWREDLGLEPLGNERQEATQD